jgi:glucose/arabinose dehydrogenase
MSCSYSSDIRGLESHGADKRVRTGAALGLVAAAVFLLIILAASSAVSAQPEIALDLVASGLPGITSITHAGDGSGRIFIVLQGGRIFIFDGSQVLPQPFLNIGPIISSGGERGLLGLAFHPSYGTNGFFYVDYTDTGGNTVIARYSVSGDPNVADPNSASILLNINQPFSNHNGGQIQFGPDGLLYIGMGDGGSGGDPQNNGQDLATLLGKILAIDVDGGAPYAIPPNNPFVDTPGALPEIWAYGLRNPWRFSFDRQTGDLFIADVGQRLWEEVNFQPSDSTGGENYGWRLMEGNHCFNPSAGCNDGSLTLPIIEYSHNLGNCSVTGGYRYRGAQNPGLAGIYFFADFCTGIIWGATEDGPGNWTTFEILDTPLSISTFGEDESGEIYVADLAGPGAFYRIRSISPLSTINLQSPANGSNQASAPTFDWIVDGGANNTYAVDMALSLSGPIFSTRENFGIEINETSWTIPVGPWNLIPNGSNVLWRVRGADLDAVPLAIVTSDEIFRFRKQ